MVKQDLNTLRALSLTSNSNANKSTTAESNTEKPDPAGEETTLTERPFTICSWSPAKLNFLHIIIRAEFYLLGYIHYSLASALCPDVSRKLLDAESLALEGT